MVPAPRAWIQNDLTSYQAVIRTLIHLNRTEVGPVKREALESFYFYNCVEEQMFYDDPEIILGGDHFNYLDAIWQNTTRLDGEVWL